LSTLRNLQACRRPYGDNSITRYQNILPWYDALAVHRNHVHVDEGDMGLLRRSIADERGKYARDERKKGVSDKFDSSGGFAHGCAPLQKSDHQAARIPLPLSARRF
jgi:hypothetical protein